MSESLLTGANHHADHEHAEHNHDFLTIEDRHAHEAETYDAMAQEILAAWDDDEYRVATDAIPFANREHVDYLTDAIEQISPLAGKRILEVGAGSGSLAVWLALQGAEVTGIDVSAGILEVAERRARISGVGDRTTFLHCPIEDFDPAAAGLPVEQFDAIIGNNVVHHFERDQALANIGRLLAPGAIAVFCEPVLFVPEWVRNLRYTKAVTKRFPPHVHSPDERSLNHTDFEIMRRHFRHVSSKPFGVTCRLQNFVELSDPAWHRLENFDRKLLTRVPAAARLARIVNVTLGLPKN